MVRNEEKIIRRCVEAVEGVVDAYCVVDTGSADKTCDIVREFLASHTGRLCETEWKNFGHNRTQSFQLAQAYVRDELGWDLRDTYGLLLDGDMVFHAGSLRDQTLTETGYTIVQRNGNLEYPNCRLVRMDYEWTCRGVTHEYWDGPTQALPASVCYIEDRNDGGCKSDKFVRDAQLLEQGLSDEPTNARYMFYLGQTYHALGLYDDSIAMYKKRIRAGGWVEEVWYSHYMIGQCHHGVKNMPKFEEWMLRAHAFRPSRAEPIYKLAKHFREVGEHYKAYHYVRMGKKIPASKDSLFIEKDVYDHLFDYETTILHYYVSPDRTAGLGECVKYLMNRPNQCVFSNLQFYVKPVGPGTRVQLPRNLFGSDYHPSSVCVYMKDDKLQANVRYVNYRMTPDRNAYEMSLNGEYSGKHAVRTLNAHWDIDGTTANPDVYVCKKSDRVFLVRVSGGSYWWEPLESLIELDLLDTRRYAYTIVYNYDRQAMLNVADEQTGINVIRQEVNPWAFGHHPDWVRDHQVEPSENVVPMNDDIGLPRRDSHIVGLEDVRVFEKSDGLYFTATTLEYSPRNRIIYGKYVPEQQTYSDCVVLESPLGPDTPCEKNWLGVPFTNDMIYRWHPLEVGSVNEKTLDIHTRHSMPPFFSHVRGSAPPFRVNNELWTLVHFVEYSAPRKYYHLFMVLEAGTYKPLRMSLPFVFAEPAIEYCLGACWTPAGIYCVYSSVDDNPAETTIDVDKLTWLKL
jgi:glycosyltransferase involved in cell wall biosynthesis